MQKAKATQTCVMISKRCTMHTVLICICSFPDVFLDQLVTGLAWLNASIIPLKSKDHLLRWKDRHMAKQKWEDETMIPSAHITNKTSTAVLNVLLMTFHLTVINNRKCFCFDLDILKEKCSFTFHELLHDGGRERFHLPGCLGMGWSSSLGNCIRNFCSSISGYVMHAEAIWSANGMFYAGFSLAKALCHHLNSLQEEKLVGILLRCCRSDSLISYVVL